MTQIPFERDAGAPSIQCDSTGECEPAGSNWDRAYEDGEGKVWLAFVCRKCAKLIGCCVGKTEGQE